MLFSIIRKIFYILKILITGSAGFIGFSLSLKLLKKGLEIFGIDNHNHYYDPTLKEARLSLLKKYPNYKHFKIDISEKEPILDLFTEIKPNVVVNLDAQAGVRYSIDNPHAYINSNIKGFLHILEGCRYNNVTNLVYASSSSVYGSNTKIPFKTSDGVDHPLRL